MSSWNARWGYMLLKHLSLIVHRGPGLVTYGHNEENGLMHLVIFRQIPVCVRLRVQLNVLGVSPVPGACRNAPYPFISDKFLCSSATHQCSISCFLTGRNILDCSASLRPSHGDLSDFFKAPLFSVS